MSRERLPNRRHSTTEDVCWPQADGKPIHVTVGLSVDRRVLECFARGGGRVGSETDFLLDDVAVLLSRALQHGDSLQEIARGVGRLPGGLPASLAGAVIDKAAELERLIRTELEGNDCSLT